MNNERASLVSEITELKSLLASIPPENLIERMSLESRLTNVQETLDAVPKDSGQKATLTFRGKPVFGSHGIAVDFSGRAVAAFADAFAAVAAGLSEGLRYMGPIPSRDKNQLLITGTAIGSFGFEFELPPTEPTLFPESASPENAMGKIETLFRLTAEGSDDDVAEAIEDVHPRAVKKVYEFLDLLVQQHAWCGLEFGDRFFRYADHAQITAARERLKDENIQEREEVYQGELQGVLPTGRTFEFLPKTQERPIKGRFDRAVEDPSILNREWLLKPITMKLNMMQVGQGRPRYTLMSLDDVSLSEGEN